MGARSPTFESQENSGKEGAHPFCTGIEGVDMRDHASLSYQTADSLSYQNGTYGRNKQI